MSVANLKPLIPGQTWLTGVGAPNPQFGYKTQFYLDTVTGTIYQKTDTLIWTVAGTMNPSGDAPVKSVNGEIGFVVLNAADVGAIPTSEKGAANGVASLDGTGKVPTSQLPASTAPVTSVNGEIGAVILDAADVGAIPTSEKGAANGVASLDSTGKVPTSQLPPSPGAPVTSVNGEIGAVVLDAADVGAVALTGATMTGVLTMGPVSTGAGETGQIALKELTANGIFSVTLRAPDQLANYVVLTLPTTHGTNGQVLTTDGTGILSWTSPGGTVAGTLSHPNTGSTFELNKNSVGVGQYTTAIGVDSGINNSGEGNSFYGAWSGRDSTTGTYNTAIGSFALYRATTSSNTTALGSLALNNLTSGNYNIAIGYSAGQYLTSGNTNLFINSSGQSSGFTGSGNNIIGQDSFGFQAIIPTFSNMNDWFALGTQRHKYYMPGVFRSNIVLAEKPDSAGLGELRFRELDANGSNYVGFKAASSITANILWTLPATDGTSNQVLTTNGSGILSWASPGGAVAGTLSHPTDGSTFELNLNNPSMTGTENTFIGASAGSQITDGFRNTGLGYQSLRLLTTGVSNTALGNQALALLTSGQSNTAIGYQSLQQLGTGGQNVAIGSGSGQLFTNSSNNTFINSAGSSGAIDGALRNCFIGVGSVFPEEAISGSNYSNWFVLGGSVDKYVLPGKVTSRLVLDRFTESGTSYGGTLSFESIGSGSNKISFSAPFSIPSNVNYTLPASDGSDTQVLTTNGSGVLSWTSPGGAVAGTLSHPTSYSTVELGRQPFMVGTYNTIIGEGTAGGAEYASYNTLFGAGIATGNFSGGSNAVVGAESGSGMTTAAYNSIFGFRAGYRLSKGEENVLVGLLAAQYLGSNVVSYLESVGNVIVGARAASSLNKGNYNLVLGANSGVIFINSASPNNYNTIINCEGGDPQSSTNVSGCVLIGRDSSGFGPVLPGSTVQVNQFILGTENHSYHMPGTFYSPIKLAPPSFNGKIVFTGFGTASTITLEAPDSITFSVVYKLPTADGAPGQSLKTDGAGNLYWG